MIIPEELLNSLNDINGFSKSQFLESHRQSSVTSIRLNPNKVNEEETKKLELVEWNPSGRYLKERPIFSQNPLWHSGSFYVQEASSMVIGRIVNKLFDVNEPIVALDLCASPGGKTTNIADVLNRESLIVANEVNSKRVGSLKENIIKWGAGNILVSNSSPEKFNKLANIFDLVLVDAPCSGSGMFRKDEFALKQWSPNLVESCSLQQKKILSEIVPTIKDGGILIYSTCSYSIQENEEICDYILKKFDLEECKIELFTNGITEVYSNETKKQGFRFWPHITQGEGFFVSVFRKKGNLRQNNFEILKSSKNPLNLLGEKWLNDNFTFPFKMDIRRFSNTLCLIQSKHGALIELLNRELFVIYQGLDLATEVGKDIIPEHPILMQTIAKYREPIVELNLKDALLFLAKQSINVNSPKGWVPVCYLGQELGWIKQLGSRSNNYYPKEWKLRNIQ